MVYAISISVIAFFLLLYFITRKKERDGISVVLNESEYAKSCHNFALLSPLPKEGSTTNAKKYVFQIKLNAFLLDHGKNKKLFDVFFEDKRQLEKLFKVDFSKLDDLPSLSNEPRAVKMARICLENSDYMLIGDRIKILFDECNKKSTITFQEIMTMKEAFLYVILEKCHFLYKDLRTIQKVMQISQKYVKDEGIIARDKRYKSYSNSKLFMSMCAASAIYQDKKHMQTLVDRLDELYQKYAILLNSANDALLYDFSIHYTPLEIFDKFDVFSNATENEKINFLSLLSSLSDKENLDEFMYAIRVEKCMQTSSFNQSKVKSLSLPSRKFCLISTKNDISSLVLALRHSFFMKMLFGDKKQANLYKTISKIVDFENTFEPCYRFSSINFGISTTNDVLRISPRLPKEIQTCDVTFVANGTLHNLHVKRGNEEQIYLGNTKIKGTRMIKLSKTPLDITVYTKD